MKKTTGRKKGKIERERGREEKKEWGKDGDVRCLLTKLGEKISYSLDIPILQILWPTTLEKLNFLLAILPGLFTL